MDEPVRAHAPHRHLVSAFARPRRHTTRQLARSAPRLASGLVVAIVLGGAFVPTVIRIYGSGGSLAAADVPGMVAVGSLLANALLLALAVAALARGRDHGAGAR